MFALPIHRRVDNFCFPFRPTQNDRQIFLEQTMLLHEQSESPRGRGSFCTRTSPLVSRSNRFTIETWPPLAISNASSSRNSFQSVVLWSVFVGCVNKNAGLSTTM